MCSFFSALCALVHWLPLYSPCLVNTSTYWQLNVYLESDLGYYYFKMKINYKISALPIMYQSHKTTNIKYSSSVCFGLAAYWNAEGERLTYRPYSATLTFHELFVPLLLHWGGLWIGSEHPKGFHFVPGLLRVMPYPAEHRWQILGLKSELLSLLYWKTFLDCLDYNVLPILSSRSCCCLAAHWLWFMSCSLE